MSLHQETGKTYAGLKTVGKAEEKVGVDSA